MSNYHEKRKLLDEYIQSEIEEYPNIDSYSRLDPDNIITLPDNCHILFISQCFVDSFQTGQLFSQKDLSLWIILTDKHGHNLRCSINPAEYVIFYKPFSQENITVSKEGQDSNFTLTNEQNEEDDEESEKESKRFISYKSYYFKKKQLKELKKQQKEQMKEQQMKEQEQKQTNTQDEVIVNKLQEPKEHDQDQEQYKEPDQKHSDKNKSYERYQRYKEKKKKHRDFHDKYSKHSKEHRRKKDDNFECKLQYEDGVIKRVKVPRKITL